MTTTIDKQALLDWLSQRVAEIRQLEEQAEWIETSIRYNVRRLTLEFVAQHIKAGDFDTANGRDK